MTSLADVQRRTRPNDITESSRATTRKIVSAANIVLFAASLFGVEIGLPGPSRAHEFHDNFSAGEPGDPKKPARVVNVKMFEGSGKMGFEPARIEVRKGEQVRFVLQNKGEEDHEFVLATDRKNRKHAEVMRTHSNMEHDDPNARRVLPYGNGELICKFTKRGEFEFACLIPGHYEKGMFGKVIVK
jgi:uncharacterized cupredoxin-like copper-binding protein